MAGGFTSVAHWQGFSGPQTGGGGYITLPWWQAGGGVGADPEVSVTKSGKTQEKLKRREKLQAQFEKERQELFDRIFGTERSVEARIEVKPDSSQEVVIDRPTMTQVNREVAQQLQKFIDRQERKRDVHQLRQQLVAAVRRELKLREEEEELLVFMLLHGEE